MSGLRVRSLYTDCRMVASANDCPIFPVKFLFVKNMKFSLFRGKWFETRYVTLYTTSLKNIDNESVFPVLHDNCIFRLRFLVTTQQSFFHVVASLWRNERISEGVFRLNGQWGVFGYDRLLGRALSVSTAVLNWFLTVVVFRGSMLSNYKLCGFWYTIESCVTRLVP